jgi:hypothetical protein
VLNENYVLLLKILKISFSVPLQWPTLAHCVNCHRNPPVTSTFCHFFLKFMLHAANEKYLYTSDREDVPNVPEKFLLGSLSGSPYICYTVSAILHLYMDNSVITVYIFTILAIRKKHTHCAIIVMTFVTFSCNF